MKKQVILSLIIFISITLLISCSRPIEKKLAGLWKVEDVKFDTRLPIDQGTLDASKESAKAVSYELLEDFTAKIHVGSTVLDGNWAYKEAEAGVYMIFSGSFDTVLLGRYEEGRLINVEDQPDIRITTIFNKE
jgi:hypothetical protein